MVSLTNEFPDWGDTGELPDNGFFYEGGDQVNEKHLDGLWHNVQTHFDEVHTELEGFYDEFTTHDATDDAHHSRYSDSEARSAVHEAEVDIMGVAHSTQDDFDAHAADSAAHHTRYADSEARTAVDGSSVSITGAATGTAHSDLENVSSGDHHTRYTDSEARTAVDGTAIGRLIADNRIENATVQSENDLPSTAPVGSQIYVEDDEQLYVYTG